MTFEPRNLISSEGLDSETLDSFYRGLGFRGPGAAAREVFELAVSASDREALVPVIEPLLQALGKSVDPDTALLSFERYVRARGDRGAFYRRLELEPELYDTIALVFGSSPFLSGILVRHPEYFDSLQQAIDGPGRDRKEIVDGARRSIAEFRSAKERLTALHHYQRREQLRIGCRDLARVSSVEEVTDELSWLADGIIQIVFEDEWKALDDSGVDMGFEFSVIGVGKLGGEELNFSSDIDIFYIYSPEAYSVTATKLARKINRSLTEAPEIGAYYRVDLRLRPEGSRGPMASSMRSLRNYYSTWGETFERLALSKARPVAGHDSLGTAFLELAAPFVYRKYLDYAAIDEVRDIKVRIDEQVHSSGELDRNVKLGWGGIREIEFFVQALQVLYAGDIPELRVRTTLGGIERLAEAHLIEADVAQRLHDAYIFLRDVEHKLQIVDYRQTHTLPDDPEELMRCARRMKMPYGEFVDALEAHRGAVRDTFDDLFSGGAEAEEDLATLVHRFVSGAMDEVSGKEWLSELGFEDVRQAHDILVSLRDAPAFGHSPTRMKNLLANVLTPLLEAASKLTDRGRVLTRFERVASAVGAREALLRSLVENPHAIRRMARMFALSDYLSDTLIRRPGRVEFLIDDHTMAVPIDPSETASRAMFEFYVGTQHLFGTLSRKRASRLLTEFAEQAMARVIPADGPVAVFALGKFGERELNYRSDLDIIVFFEDDYGSSCSLVERLVAEFDPDFKVDLRLRPEGNKGSLVWNLDKTERYLAERAEFWERMAWTKARFVAGNPAIAAPFLPLAERFVFDPGLSADNVATMKHIRGRMERELGKETDSAVDLKLGRGGLVDLEFLAEFHQIRDRIRIPNTVLVLKRAGLGPQLIEDYYFLRELESMLRLRSTLTGTRIEEKDVAALGLMIGEEDLAGKYSEVTLRVRDAFDSFKL